MVAADYAVSLVSGAALAALGAALLTIRPRQRPQMLFAGFAILWGAQIVAANLGVVLQDARVHLVGLLVSYGLLAPAAFFLARFAAAVRPSPRAKAASLAFAAVALAAAATVVAAPRLVVALGEPVASGLPLTVLGPAAIPLFIVPFYAAFFFALATLYVEFRDAAPGTSRLRARGMLVALALFTSYTAARQLLTFAGNAAESGIAGATLGLAALFAVGALLVALLAAHHLARPAPGEGRDALLVASLALPPVFAVVESALARAGFANVQSVGAWRLLTVGALVYALARYQLFDLDLKLKWTVKQSTIAAVFIAVFFAVSEGAQTLFADNLGLGPYLGVGAASLLVFAMAPLQRVAERFSNAAMPRATGSNDYVAFRKMQVYQAALETVVRDGEVTDRERAMLTRLAHELGIDPRDARQLEEDALRRFRAAPGAPGEAKPA